jgi:hypothetical protein
MNKQFISKYFSAIAKIVIPIIAIIFVYQFTGCKDEVSSEEDTVELKSSETYKYPTVSGDEESVTIKTQAKHFDVSEIKRNSDTNYTAVYTYKSKPGFAGRDYVELETRTGSDGASPPTEVKIIRIYFVVSN